MGCCVLKTRKEKKRIEMKGKEKKRKEKKKKERKKVGLYGKNKEIKEKKRKEKKRKTCCASPAVHILNLPRPTSPVLAHFKPGRRVSPILLKFGSVVVQDK